MKKNYYRLLFVSIVLSQTYFCQDNPEDLLKMIDDKPKKEFTTATFKTTRNINFHTTEVLSKKSLDFRISHRFGDANTGPYNAWGIDGGANIRLGLEYSHDGRLMFGIGRTSAKKIADGFIKYKLLRQTTDNSMPISLTLFTSVFNTFERLQIDGYNVYQTNYDRLSYCHQIMISRKFNSRLSIQLTAAMVHFNLVDKVTDGNNCFIGGIVARYKVTKRQAITAEYGYRLNKYSNDNYYNSFGIGYDLETGGHVFQLHFTNSFGLTENQYFMYTTSSWSNWGIRLGFNISRVSHYKEKRNQTIKINLMNNKINNFKKASLIGSLCFLAFTKTSVAQIYLSEKCKISFFSETKMENIDATNSLTKPVFSAKTGAFAIKASQNAFEFKSAFMQEHYNENYMESEKYPFASFSGKLNETIDYTKDQVNTVTISGVLNMHGVDQTRTISGTLEVKNGKIIINSTFDVKVADFKVKVPSLYIEKIAEVVKVTFFTEMIKK